MRRILVILTAVALLCINLTKAQVDPEICPTGTTSFIDPNWRTIPPRFEITTELAAVDGVMEISQAFSSQRDTIFTTSMAGQIRFYWNFITNEQFQILNIVIGPQVSTQCLRQVITSQSETSVIGPNTLVLKPSTLFGFDARNQVNPSWGIQYNGTGSLRGIPIVRFVSCFYVPDIRATVSATYYVSDVNLFQAYLSPNVSIPLAIDVQVKGQNNRRDSYTYNVFRYTPNPDRREQRQALETPDGVFCLNRTNTMALPTNIPERLSSNSEAIVPQFNGSIFSTHGLFDGEFQLTRFDVVFPDPYGGPRWQHYTEIHDFAVGLAYQYNYTTDQCSVRDISANFNDGVFVDGRPDLIQMGSPQHIFLMDDGEYQYTGEKQCRDRVWCQVWLSAKQLPNNTIQYREWYWASRINGEPIQPWIPMKLVLRLEVENILISTFESTVFNFRRNPFTIFEIDFTLANCYRALGPTENYNLGVLTFKISNDNNYPVMENLNYLRLHIFETLTFVLFVRPIRISNLIVDRDGSDIVVTFTLLDTPPRTGSVEMPLKEKSFDDAVSNLKSIIDSGGLAFRARVGTKQIILRARADSLNVGFESSPKVWKASGPRITGLWVGFIIAGLVISVIGGVFVYDKIFKS